MVPGKDGTRSSGTWCFVWPVALRREKPQIDSQDERGSPGWTVPTRKEEDQDLTSSRNGCHMAADV